MAAPRFPTHYEISALSPTSIRQPSNTLSLGGNYSSTRPLIPPPTLSTAICSPISENWYNRLEGDSGMSFSEIFPYLGIGIASILGILVLIWLFIAGSILLGR
jgi:hypothetical protein